MVPEEEPRPEPQPIEGPPVIRARRRGRRGGRKHSRRMEPHPGAMMQESPPVEATPVMAPEAEVYVAPAPAEPPPPPIYRESGGPQSPLADAITQVTQIIEELKTVLNEMDEVLETLEVAERQKLDDEKEIESLQRALRQLHRPRDGGHHGR